jgi:hypothetical protein
MSELRPRVPGAVTSAFAGGLRFVQAKCGRSFDATPHGRTATGSGPRRRVCVRFAQARPRGALGLKCRLRRSGTEQIVRLT